MHKFILAIATLILLSGSTASSREITETEKIASLCKVWGLLKYFHPAVTHGRMDWDAIFISKVRELEQIHTTEDLDRHYAAWINSLGKIKKYRLQPLTYDTTCNYNKTLEWIDNKDLFSAELAAMLHDVVAHRKSRGSRFIDVDKNNARVTKFINEPVYPEMIYPTREYRLLALARYWNSIEYFFPYKYKTDQPWDDVLAEMAPEIDGAKDTLAYGRALAKLVAKVNDSHANIDPPPFSRIGSYFFSPATCKIIGDKSIIDDIRNDSLARIDDLQYGDVILSLNDTSISDRILHEGVYMGASNYSVTKRNLGYTLLFGGAGTVTIRFERNGVISSKQIHRYAWKELYHNRKAGDEPAGWKVVKAGIGYADLSKIKPEKVKKVLDDLTALPAIIFDLRHYPQWVVYDVCARLSEKKMPFCKFTGPDLSYPGKFIWDNTMECGKNNDAPYKGKIVILINENTQSRAEFTTMALRTFPNAICIGSQTAGADGNVTTIMLPGGYQTLMTGLGVYYPDGRETQRIGIVPDIHIVPTIEGIRLHKDEVLERAIEYIETGK